MKLISATLSPRLLPLATALLLAPLASQAQSTFSIGPQLGVNLSSALVEGEEAPEPKHRVGALVGFTASIGAGHFAVQPSLLYSQRGFSLEEKETETVPGFGTVSADTKATLKFDYLELPLLAVFRQQEDGSGIDQPAEQQSHECVLPHDVV